MEKAKRQLDNKLWKDFQNLQSSPHIFDSFISYFNGLASWVNKHLDVLGDALVTKNRLDSILNIDAEKYVARNPELLLDKEPIRMFGRKPPTLDSFARSISSTLWDLVKLRSGKDCPKCVDDELNYVIAEILVTKEKRIILECDTCGWTENLDQTICTDEQAVMHPANECDLKAFGLNHLKVDSECKV
ncbi:MAG: hypothetical protein LBH28_05575 [Oscillospiraceae bacterium]|nr:hypothetical protein [Oscillospiraceae bacterium]